MRTVALAAPARANHPASAPPNMHHSGKQRSVLSQKVATVPPQWGVSYLRHRHGFAVKIDGGIEAGVRLQAAACNHTVQA